MALKSETEGTDTVVEVDDEQPEDQTTTEHDDDTTSEGEGGEGQGTGGEAEDNDEVLVTIGEPPSESTDDSLQHETEALRNLRKAHRDQTTRIRELERQVKAGGSKGAEVELGPKPRMADPGIDFDEETFEKRLDEWKQRKQLQDDRQRQTQDAQKQADVAWQERQAAYGTQKGALKVKDFEDAEGNAFEALTEVQRAVILHGAENAAHVVYALGKNPAELKRIAAITEPVKFAFAIAKLEDKVKVTPKKTAPPPERVVKGSAKVSAGSVDKRLEALRAEAQRTGDLGPVMAYKRQLKQ